MQHRQGRQAARQRFWTGKITILIMTVFLWAGQGERDVAVTWMILAFLSRKYRIGGWLSLPPSLLERSVCALDAAPPSTLMSVVGRSVGPFCPRRGCQVARERVITDVRVRRSPRGPCQEGARARSLEQPALTRRSLMGKVLPSSRALPTSLLHLAPLLAYPPFRWEARM